MKSIAKNILKLFFYNINNNFLGSITSSSPAFLPRRHVRVEAFEQLFGPGRGGFEQKFFKNSNARGVPRGVPRGDVEASI